MAIYVHRDALGTLNHLIFMCSLCTHLHPYLYRQHPCPFSWMLNCHKQSTQSPTQQNSLVPLDNFWILVIIGVSAATPVLKFPLVHKQIDPKATKWDSLCGREMWWDVPSLRASTTACISIPEHLHSPRFPWNNYPEPSSGDMAQEKHTAGNVAVCLISPARIIILHHTL